MTNKSTKRRNAVVAAIAGAALLLGGSTYALWSANAGMEGGKIISGDLNITAGPSNAWDISTNLSGELRTDEDQAVATKDGIELDGLQGHAIDSLEDWPMVPGDTVALTFPYTIVLDGDNMVAQLAIGVDSDADLGDLTATIEETDDPYITMTYEVFDKDGASLGITGTIDASTTSTPVSYFQAPNITPGTEDGDIPVVTGGSEDYVLVVYVNFNKDTPKREMAGAQTLVDISNKLTATLTQVRCTGDVDSNFPTCS